jgi:hypothetical protein
VITFEFVKLVQSFLRDSNPDIDRFYNSCHILLFVARSHLIITYSLFRIIVCNSLLWLYIVTIAIISSYAPVALQHLQ